ncbi:hypothetical protein P4O66_022477 [Electrophorus voltai]|uniref:Uncharacterized protein n=1 Tax=Electrophorus voltai TaxID=2609070 RepID=A0AAD8ZP37_9TELE|nr:hypothetical protein P4O66_022477 [Electrophorus voltai]
MLHTLKRSCAPRLHFAQKQQNERRVEFFCCSEEKQGHSPSSWRALRVPALPSEGSRTGSGWVSFNEQTRMSTQAGGEMEEIAGENQWGTSDVLDAQGHS